MSIPTIQENESELEVFTWVTNLSVKSFHFEISWLDEGHVCTAFDATNEHWKQEIVIEFEHCIWYKKIAQIMPTANFMVKKSSEYLIKCSRLRHDKT